MKISPFFNFDHVGLVVKDISRAVEFYQSLGIGPFEEVTTPVAEKKFRGKPTVGHGVELRIARLGQIKMELVQPIKGESAAMEFLEKRGEGINHICFSVNDIERESSELVKEGFRVVSSVRFQEGGGNAYLESDKLGGFCVELIQPPPE